jgi:hypothetical protein
LGGVFVGLIGFVSLNLFNMVAFGLSFGLYFFCSGGGVVFDKQTKNFIRKI